MVMGKPKQNLSLRDPNMHSPLDNSVCCDASSKSTGNYSGATPKDLLARIQDHVEEYDLPSKRAANRLDVEYGKSRVSYAVGDTGFSVGITAKDSGQVYQTREAVNYLLDHVFPQASQEMTWSGEEISSTNPPNFQICHVLSVSRVSANFLRVVLKCEDVTRLSSGAIHFSLLIPPEGQPVVWPTLNDRKRTVWPTGDEKLHRAVYTFVDFDLAANSFSFDIYEHAGGHTTRWAQSALPGKVVGITGPGGGEFPVSDKLLMAGDETALPAIRRILACAPKHTIGLALIEVGDPSEIIPFACPEGVQIDWVVRTKDNGLWTKLSQIRHVPKGTFVWVAAEREIVRKAKDAFLEMGIDKAASYFSRYWVA